jgi:hypothetical protein
LEGGWEHGWERDAHLEEQMEGVTVSDRVRLALLCAFLKLSKALVKP